MREPIEAGLRHTHPRWVNSHGEMEESVKTITRMDCFAPTFEAFRTRWTKIPASIGWFVFWRKVTANQTTPVNCGSAIFAISALSAGLV